MTNEVFANSPVPGTVSAIGTLASNVTSSATSWTLNAALPAVLQSGGQFHALVDHEIVVIPTQTGTSLTGIIRGSSLASPDTCTSSAHSAGASIYPLLTAGALENALAAAGGGGSTAVATFTNVSTAQTLNSFVTDPVQIVELTGNPVITIPSGPAGAACSGVIEFVQDSTGGRVWGFSGSVFQPGGPVNPAGTPTNPSDYVFVQWDGAMWAAFPATSGPAVISVLGILIEGAVAGLTPVRELGGQATGTAPPYTPPSGNLEIVPDTGLAGGFGYWYSPVGSTTWSSFTGAGGSFSGVVVSSPGPYQRPSYDTATSTWLAANPELVDVAAHYNVRTGSSDVSAALATGIQDICAAGLKPFLAPGMVSGTPTPYKLANPLVIGNGSSSALSTWTGALEGVSVPTVTGVTSFYALPQTLATRFIWTASSGYSGAMVQILGPVASVWLKNVLFDANGNTPLLGIETISVRNSHFENLAFLNAKGGAVHTTVGAAIGSTNTNDSRNTWKRISYGVLGHGSTLCAGIQFTNGSLGVGGDSCYEEYDGVWIETSASGPPAGNMGIWFQACDSIRMRNVNIAAGGWQGATLWDYTASGGAHPADCIIDLVEMGGQQFGALQLGSPAGAGVARNRITKISACNGQPPNPILQTGQPSGYGPVTNTTWGSDNLTGQVQMASGVGTVSRVMISWLNSGIGGTSFSDLPVQMRFSLPGAPGTGGAGQLWVDSVSGTTATIKSTNTSDNSLYNWELLSP